MSRRTLWKVGKRIFRAGMKVTTKIRKEAYYSGYAGNPVVFFEPGMEGTIGVVDVPAVRTPDGKDRSFCCIDFVIGGKEPKVGDLRRKENTWRCSLYPEDIVILDKPAGNEKVDNSSIPGSILPQKKKHGKTKKKAS